MKKFLMLFILIQTVACNSSKLKVGQIVCSNTEQQLKAQILDVVRDKADNVLLLKIVAIGDGSIPYVGNPYFAALEDGILSETAPCRQ